MDAFNPTFNVLHIVVLILIQIGMIFAFLSYSTVSVEIHFRRIRSFFVSRLK